MKQEVNQADPIRAIALVCRPTRELAEDLIDVTAFISTVFRCGQLEAFAVETSQHAESCRKYRHPQLQRIAKHAEAFNAQLILSVALSVSVTGLADGRQARLVIRHDRPG